MCERGQHALCDGRRDDGDAPHDDRQRPPLFLCPSTPFSATATACTACSRSLSKSQCITQFLVQFISWFRLHCPQRRAKKRTMHNALRCGLGPS